MITNMPLAVKHIIDHIAGYNREWAMIEDGYIRSYVFLTRITGSYTCCPLQVLQKVENLGSIGGLTKSAMEFGNLSRAEAWLVISAADNILHKYSNKQVESFNSTAVQKTRQYMIEVLGVADPENTVL